MGHLAVCAELGRAHSLARAIDAPPPRPGQSRRTAIPDNWNGIRFEIGRMRSYVRAARTDGVVVDCARVVGVGYAKMAEELAARRGENVRAHNNKGLMLEGLDLWCREHFCYVNDPPGKEVLQTPGRMVRFTRVPRDVIRHILEPLYRAMEEYDPTLRPRDHEPPPVFIGDCIPWSQKVIVHSPTDRRYRQIPAGELKDSWRSYQVVSYNETEGDEKFEFKPIARFIDKGTLPVYRVSLSNGTSFRCTAEHRVYAFERTGTGNFSLRVMRLSELLERRSGKYADRYTVPCAVRIPEGKVRGKHIPEISNAQLWVEGLYVAEGWAEASGKGRRKTTSYTKRAKIGMNNPHAITALKTNLAVIGQPYGEHLRDDGLVTIRMGVSKFTTRLGNLFGLNSAEKRFPDWYGSLPQEKLSVLLSAYALGDGYVPTHGQWKDVAHLVYNTKSEKLARQLQFMHMVLGRPVSFYHQPAWHEKPAMYRLYEYIGGNKQKLPELGSSRITAIERDGEERCCDITVKDNSNFVLDGGPLVHNCDEAATIFCSLCACLDIGPVQFAFGGDGGTLHHVWSRVFADGEWWDVDLTEPDYRLGDFSKFDHYDEVEIPL